MVWEARLQGMAPEIDGRVYLTDIEVADGHLGDTGDAVRIEISKTDAYDLIGKVVEILPRPRKRPSVTQQPREAFHRITTGAPLRVLG